MRAKNLVRGPLAVLLAAGLTTLVAPAATAGAAPSAPAGNSPIHYLTSEKLASGVTYRSFEFTTPAGTSIGYLATADLRNPKVSVGLLHPATVAERKTVSAMVTDQHALVGVNGDFFNISETHAGVEPTGSSNGPEIADGKQLKAAVPNSQRFGPMLPPGTSTRDVFGVGVDRRARLSSLTLHGTIRSRAGTIAVTGFNQYALPVGGVGVFDSGWGTVSRLRATCGSDTSRLDPCSTDTYEVTVRHGVVTSVGQTPGAGAIPRDTVVLVGRDAGADQLDDLVPGDRVSVDEHLDAADHPRLTFAVGGYPILRDGQPLAGIEADPAAAVRTAVGTSRDGRTVYLVTLDGRAPGVPFAGGTAVGGRPLKIDELATLMASIGADDAVNVDGGGSSTVAVRGPGEAAATPRNNPSGGAERAVANGIGIFAGRR
jgi:hypothetical protein